MSGGAGSDPERGRLAAKLRRSFGSGSAQPSPTLRKFLQRRASRIGGRHEPAVKAELPEGEDIENAAGHCYVRQLRYPLGFQHGAVGLEQVRGVDWPQIAVLGKDPAFGTVGVEQCLFLDTETTGLAGGAGTTVFMTGIGWVEADEFVLEQVFLRSFADEPAALEHVATRLRQHPLMVTFVGKSFDRHRLAARMAVHHVEAPVLDPLHLDLYYLARRRWGKQLPNVRLRTVEESRLGLWRDDDMPGSEAPYAFLAWVRDGTGPIARVFEHNRLDVLSLVTLLAKLGGDSAGDV